MTDPDKKPSYQDIAGWSLSIAGYWKHVAAKLGLPGEKIQNIAKSLALYPTVEEQALQMLEEWRQTGNATCRKMAEALRTLDKGGLANEICPPQASSRSSPPPSEKATGNKHVLLLAETWDSTDDSGLSIIGKEVAVEFARNEHVQVSCLVSEIDDELREKAMAEKVHLFCAKGCKGLPRRECLDYPAEYVSGVNVIITYGKHLGKFGLPLKEKFTNSKWVHIACSKSEEGTEEQDSGELQHCREADLALAIGIDAAEEYERRLQYDGKAVDALTPGIYADFDVRQFSKKSTATFRVAVFYPPAVEIQASPERYSVAVKAVSSVSSTSYCLISVCAPGDDVKTVRGVLDEVKKLPSSQHQMHRYCRDVKERMRLFAGVDLLILPFLPSTSDHFGLVALQAISCGLPVLVTWESGIGRALRDILHGDARIVDCDDPERWRFHIQNEKEKNNRIRYDEAIALRTSWGEKYPWGEQCAEALERILELA